eukprot:CAMPEP_0178399710 /NCGR_PEP_ID=MMETSP0689_2-20121128/15417_1 /TAXON_ID=160604 /ORGANISM="Amphidinium massartii, Strain CS-259" /LENGTH=539 /DNA_ID=CAMNT_0020020489 /DNA_START=52 /DNA_END=1672 /DNA_ORIENTATION=+
MITYRQGGIRHIQNLFLMSGSVFPFSSMVSMPSAVIAFTLKMLVDTYDVEDWFELLEDQAPWSSFSTVVGFLIVFRTSQSYARFWDGATATHAMRADWLEACRSAVAFCEYSSASPELLKDFKSMVVRLFSMLHALALAEIEDCTSDDPRDVQGFNLELFDAGSLDEESLKAIKLSDSKVELVMQWILGYIIEQMETGGVLSIPAPVLSRLFHELASGYLRLQSALVISTIPFPFPYAQACDCVLVIYSLALPVFIVSHVRHASMAALLAFAQVFALQTLNNISIEIENPFGTDANDLDLATLQSGLTAQMRHLIEGPAARLPSCVRSDQPDDSFVLDEDVVDDADPQRVSTQQRNSASSFYNIWTTPSARSSTGQAQRSSRETAFSVHAADSEYIEERDGEGASEAEDEEKDGDHQGAAHAVPVGVREPKVFLESKPREASLQGSAPASPMPERQPRSSSKPSGPGELSMSTVSFTLHRGGGLSSAAAGALTATAAGPRSPILAGYVVSGGGGGGGCASTIDMVIGSPKKMERSHSRL